VAFDSTAVGDEGAAAAADQLDGQASEATAAAAAAGLEEGKTPAGEGQEESAPGAVAGAGAGAGAGADAAAAAAAAADALGAAVKQEQQGDDEQQQQQQQDGPVARYVRVVPLNNEGEGGAALHSVAPGMAPNVPVNLVGKSHWHFGTHYKVG
jgi:hypothetical protein